jgi:DNA-binding protein HU-beta
MIQAEGYTASILCSAAQRDFCAPRDNGMNDMATKIATKAPAKGAAPTAKKAAAAPAKIEAVKAPAKPPAPLTVTVKHLAAGLAEKHEMTKKLADSVVADMFEMVVTHLKDGDRVRIAGIGILEVKDRPARMGRNPATGAAIEIKASKKIAFRVAKELKDAI